MKKSMMLLCMAAGVLLAGSCTKTMENRQPQKMNITLTASIGNPGTKTSYSEKDEGGLTVKWDDEEWITVILVNADGTYAGYDNISGTKIDDKNYAFKGTVTAKTEGQNYLCVYPSFGMSQYTYPNSGTLEKDVTEVLEYNGTDAVAQDASGSTTHLKKTDLMTGVPVMDDEGNAEVTLERQIGILKLEIAFPNTENFVGKTIGLIAFMPVDEAVTMTPNLNIALKDGSVTPVGSDFLLVSYFGSIPFGGKLVAYAPLGPCTMPAGTYKIVIQTGEEDFMSTIITGSSDVVVEKGRMSTLKIDKSSEADWSEGF